MQAIKHALTSYDNDSDTCQVEVKLESRQIEINILEDLGKEVNGAVVDEGYTRTVRLEVKNGELKVMVYGALSDEPRHLAINLNEEKPRIVE